MDTPTLNALLASALDADKRKINQNVKDIARFFTLELAVMVYEDSMLSL